MKGMRVHFWGYTLYVMVIKGKTKCLVKNISSVRSSKQDFEASFTS